MKASQFPSFRYNFGLALGVLLILAWGLLLVFNLHYPVQFQDPVVYGLMLLQTYLFTGLFITAHDAMHGTVSPNKTLNKVMGWLSAGLFAYNYYPQLCRNHYKHHGWVAQADDPDYHEGPFWVWYYHFLKHYIGFSQLVLMALTYNLLALVFPERNIIQFWVVPSILSTLQLFYFGTYLPHKQPEAKDNRHKSTTQQKNHLWALLSCYFFGYHYEHHEHPGLPWWLLYKAK